MGKGLYYGAAVISCTDGQVLLLDSVGICASEAEMKGKIQERIQDIKNRGATTVVAHRVADDDVLLAAELIHKGAKS